MPRPSYVCTRFYDPGGPPENARTCVFGLAFPITKNNIYQTFKKILKLQFALLHCTTNEKQVHRNANEFIEINLKKLKGYFKAHLRQDRLECGNN